MCRGTLGRPNHARIHVGNVFVEWSLMFSVSATYVFGCVIATALVLIALKRFGLIAVAGEHEPQRLSPKLVERAVSISEKVSQFDVVEVDLIADFLSHPCPFAINPSAFKASTGQSKSLSPMNHTLSRSDVLVLSRSIRKGAPSGFSRPASSEAITRSMDLSSCR